jgi:hypothetical protein
MAGRPRKVELEALAATADSHRALANSALHEAIRHRLFDEVMDVYLGWREECVALQETYDLWCVAAGADRRLAHAAYRASLEREETAAESYRDLAQRASVLLRLIAA